MSTPSPTAANQPWDRSNFSLLIAGFSYALIFIAIFNLRTRKYVRDDKLVLAAILSWLVYISIQIVDSWTKKTVTGAIPQFYWAIATATLFYNFTLCSILHSSFKRFLALTEIKSLKDHLTYSSHFIVGTLFIVRGVRTGFVYSNSSNNNIPNAALTQTATSLQLATLFPFLVLRVAADVVSLAKLVRGRIKFASNCNNHVVGKAGIYIVVEIFLGILAFIVALEEALLYTGVKPAFIDWLLVSWCLVGWVDQHNILRKLFEVNTSNTNADTKQKGTGGGSRPALGVSGNLLH